MVAEGAGVPFPTKYVSAGALFLDDRGRLLVVRPTYKEGWEIPGGIVERDESPTQACRREVREEIGFDVVPGQLLVVDYRSRQGDRSDSLQFVFLGGVLTPAQIGTIRLQPSELSEYRFVHAEAAVTLLGETLARRVAAGLRAIAGGRTLMLHDGHEIAGSRER